MELFTGIQSGYVGTNERKHDDQATGLRDFVAQQNAETEANRALLQSYRDEFDRLTDPHSDEPYKDRRGNIVVDVAPITREGFADYCGKLRRGM
jgi:hypothetical protein